MTGLFQVRTTIIDDRNPYDPFYNMFGYKSNIPVVDEVNELANNFISGVVPKIRAVIHEVATVTAVEVFELNGTSFTSRTLGTGADRGTRTGDPEPKFVAWGFKLVRASLGGRSGAKRFSPISEADLLQGEANGSIVAALNTLADQLKASLFAALIETWFPVIVSKPVSPTNPYTSHGVGGCFYQRVTTQNSRKR